MLLWTSGCKHLFQLVFTFFLTDIYLGMEMLDHNAVLVLVFWGHSILFFMVGAPVYFPTNSIKGFLLFISLETFIWRLFSDSHSVRWEVINTLLLPFSFPFALLRQEYRSGLPWPHSGSLQDPKPHFMLLSAICVSSLEKCLFRDIYFLTLSCMNYLYMSEINALSVISFANIFSH